MKRKIPVAILAVFALAAIGNVCGQDLPQERESNPG
jgi:hypothetical protein